MSDDPNAPVTNKQLNKALIFQTKNFEKKIDTQSKNFDRKMDLQSKSFDKKMEELTDTIINGMQKMQDEQDVKDENFKREMKQEFAEVKKRLEVTPSRKEFEMLKRKVYRHHPSN